VGLPAQDSADVGAYFASRTNGLPPFVGERFQAGHTLREDNPAIRLVFAEDPARGIRLARPATVLPTINSAHPS
jgi:hypothetical protein